LNEIFVHFYTFTDWDRRTLMAIMERFYTSDVMNVSNFRLAEDGNGAQTKYIIPSEETLYNEYISKKKKKMEENEKIKEKEEKEEDKKENKKEKKKDNKKDNKKDTETADDTTTEDTTTSESLHLSLKDYTPSRDEYRMTIERWPLNAPPSVYGMHRNAEITFQLKESNDLIRTIVTMGGGGGGDTNSSASNADQEVEETCQKLIEVVPVDLNSELAYRGIFDIDPKTDLMNSLDTVLSQELMKFNRLLGSLRSTLVKLTRAIKGLAVMSVELEAMYHSFLLGTVPTLWSNVSFVF
jgi:hypothetical protein